MFLLFKVTYIGKAQFGQYYITNWKIENDKEGSVQVTLTFVRESKLYIMNTYIPTLSLMAVTQVQAYSLFYQKHL